MSGLAQWMFLHALIILLSLLIFPLLMLLIQTSSSTTNGITRAKAATFCKP
jgi:hypothetical protein